MRFTFDKEKNDIIKYYTVDGDNHYKIVYLNGDYDDFYSDDPDEEKNIIKLMVEQAISRDLQNKEINYKNHINKQDVQLIISTISGLLSLYMVHEFGSNGHSNISKTNSLIMSIIAAFSFACSLDINFKQSELKKYSLFLEMLNNDKGALNLAISNAMEKYYGSEQIYYPQINRFGDPSACINYIDIMPNGLFRKICKEYSELERSRVR